MISIYLIIFATLLKHKSLVLGTCPDKTYINVYDDMRCEKLNKAKTKKLMSNYPEEV